MFDQVIGVAVPARLLAATPTSSDTRHAQLTAAGVGLLSAPSDVPVQGELTHALTAFLHTMAKRWEADGVPHAWLLRHSRIVAVAPTTPSGAATDDSSLTEWTVGASGVGDAGSASVCQASARFRATLSQLGTVDGPVVLLTEVRNGHPAPPSGSCFESAALSDVTTAMARTLAHVWAGAMADVSFDAPAASDILAEYVSAGARAYNARQEMHFQHWHSHIEHSRAAILAGATGASKECVVVFGCGRGHEIPLLELAQQFKRVVLVDIDGASLRAARDAIPLDAVDAAGHSLRDKVELEVRDITGGALERLVQGGVNIIQAHSDPMAAISALAKFASDFNFDSSSWDPPSASYVVASCVIRELLCYPETLWYITLRERFGSQLERAGYDVAQPSAFLNALGARCAAALRLQIGHMLQPGGRLYVCDKTEALADVQHFEPSRRAMLNARLGDLLRSWPLQDVLRKTGRDALTKHVASCVAAAFGGSPQPPSAQLVDATYTAFSSGRFPEVDALIVAAVSMLFGTGHLSFEREAELVDCALHTIEQLDPEPRMLDQPYQSEAWGAAGFELVGPERSWTWVSVPVAAVQGAGYAFRLRAGVFKAA